MARGKIYRFKMNTPGGKIPEDGFIESDGTLILPRLLRPKDLAKYNLVDLNKGFSKLTIYRTSIDMKQTTLSRLTGIPVRTIQGWELRGLNEAKAIKAVQIADVLKCNVKELMETEE